MENQQNVNIELKNFFIKVIKYSIIMLRVVSFLNCFFQISFFRILEELLLES